MSRWLAIFDQQGRIPAADCRRAFEVYPHFQSVQLTELPISPGSWMGIWGNGAGTHVSGISVLFDGAVYTHDEPGKEADWLAAQYHRQGRFDLSSLNGRWSFLLHDRSAQSLWLARDRVGVKPLYYWHEGHRWVFASEPKLILELPFVERAFDPEAVFDYFVLSKVDTQRETLFKGIRQLLPAHELTVDLRSGQWEEKRFYSLPFNPGVGRFKESEAISWQYEIREKLDSAVKLRLQYHDTPPATFLSGGLDSSVLACLLRSHSGEPLTALTASYREAEFAEQHWAKIVVDHLGAQWLQTFPTIEGLREDLADFIFSQDTPTFSAGTYSQYCLFRMARKNGVPFVFDGQGADALFAGHLPHLPPLWRDLFRSGQWRALAREWKAFGPLWKAWTYERTHWMKYDLLPSTPPFFQHLFKRWYFPELQYLHPDILALNRSRYETETDRGPKTLNDTLQNGYFNGPLSFLLKCVDRASAWAGVETCTPYSDDSDLMETVFSIPGIYKIRNGTRKWLLRESCRDILPPDTYHRQDKMGLVTPNNAWMAQLRPLMRAYLEEQDDGLFNKKKLLAEYEQFFDPKSPLENFRIYKYLSMVIWRSIYKV
ncbi:MAG: hypothetical protein IPL49_15585 [Saprospirales bacterium]|nr:hypothetical protein [Saprospirales bacterium]